MKVRELKTMVVENVEPGAVVVGNPARKLVG